MIELFIFATLTFSNESEVIEHQIRNFGRNGTYTYSDGTQLKLTFEELTEEENGNIITSGIKRPLHTEE